jgi:hypothetical protein
MADKKPTKKAPSSEDLTILDPHTSDILREQVESNSPPEDGTVVVFEYTWQIGSEHIGLKPSKRAYYTFAALWVAGQWYVTGQHTSLSRTYTHVTFMQMLATENVRKASVAARFEAFKP